MAKNKILVNLLLESGDSQEKSEVSISWVPINFMIYSNLFGDIIDESIREWVSDNKMQTDTNYELIFQHVIESDGAGGIHSEYFEAINIDIG